MRYPIAQITNGPSPSAAMVVDFMEEPLAIDEKEPIALGRPDVIFDASGFPVEGGRKVTVPVLIFGTGADVGQAMQQVARAICVPGRWLMIQRSATADPVWHRIRTSSSGTIDLSRVFPARLGSNDRVWRWDLELVVDSTAVGERRAIPKRGTDSPTASVTNTGGDRGIVLDPPGEAPSPIRCDIKPSVSMDGRRIMVSSFSVPWGSPLLNGDTPHFIYSDASFEPSVHASRSGGKGFLSGGDGITVPMDSASDRQYFTGPGGTRRMEPGRYLVMVRLYREGGSGQCEVRMGQRWFGYAALQPWRTWRPTSGGSRSSWLVLGTLQHPIGDTGVGLLPEEIIAPDLEFRVRCTETSSALLHMDQVAFVPVDLERGAGERAMFAQFDTYAGAGDSSSWRVDSENQRIGVVDAFGQHHNVPQPARTGGWPVAVPGMATCVSIFLDTTDAPVGVDSVAVTSQLTVTTAPRLLHLGQER